MKKTRKEHSIFERSKIITLFEEKYSFSEISEKTNIPRSTVQHIIEKYKETSMVINIKGRGRKRKTSEAQDKKIVNYVRKNFRSSSRELNKKIKLDLDLEVKILYFLVVQKKV